MERTFVRLRQTGPIREGCALTIQGSDDGESWTVLGEIRRAPGGQRDDFAWLALEVPPLPHLRWRLEAGAADRDRLEVEVRKGAAR